jgi:hypothetical protein
MMSAPMRRATGLAPMLVLLVLFGSCLGSRSVRGGCACGPEAPASTAAPDPGATGGGAHVAEEAPPAGGTAAPAPAEVPAVLPDFTDPAWTRVTSRAGKYRVCWRSLAGGVPRNQDFELEAWVLRDGAPVRDAHLFVSAWMPDHGHGMLRQPRAEPRADGSFRVEGMLLHMRGHWQLFFEVLEGTLSETAECALDL